ncbi:M20/M25/M40 family metallo-hydrolase [Cupriavidus metallidurans]|jgi:acetylornithine deacetylase/succinyl-diaminopimelate desuccinylase family protein|uniref:M20/M25/M40 family metallo-hydrolase n=2 Tax=Burkholderiaceae TaxID=119060 RepID=A0A2L0XBB2_9BURK|nr:peptidase M20 [Cupriavidus metallidurans]KWR84530.1 peptidase M20 [Cupriavidus sp. SHE]QBP11382.1 M20/M25/M40 family metallo-hydrolase [Cupriavidus metallidurans]QWC88456.1 M20/M25/M40 family metallo-hydrolase [Cupriavidus metallidurans]
MTARDNMNPVETTLTQYIDQHRPQQEAFLAGLVKVPSDNPPGDCDAHGKRAKELLEGLGFKVEAHKVPEDKVRAAGMISATNLLVRKTFGNGGPTIAMNAHGDVVPPGLGWTKDPYGGEIADSEHGPVMFGRGVAVSKSDFATYAYAVLALQEAEKQGAKLNGTVELQFTYDEETGGDIGPKFLLDEGLTKPDYAISAGFSYGITSAHNGCLHVEVTVKGKQGHAAMPHTGVDAIEAATHILQAIYGLRAELATRKSKVLGIDTATLNVGLIKGGINTNVVPDLVTFRVDRRMIPEEIGFDAEGELRAVVEKAAKERPGIEVKVERIILAEPLSELPGVEKLIGALKQRAESVFGVEIPVQGVPLYTDARHYTSRGIPTVLYGAGPRTLMEARGHNSDENLRLNDLNRATKVVALALSDLMA